MKYIEGEGFILTEGDSWNNSLLVLQLVNPQGAWIDEVTISNGREPGDSLLESISKYIPTDQPYRILKRVSVETILKIND